MTPSDPTLFPVLDATRCVRSGDCVAACPTKCLEMTDCGPWLARPADCVACGVCAAVCPADAIRMAEDASAKRR